MSTVRRCDNPKCGRGEYGYPSTSEVANPAGWIHGNLSPVAPLPDGVARTVNGDFCSAECAAQALLIVHGSGLVVTADKVSEPLQPVPPAAPKRKPRKATTKAR